MPNGVEEIYALLEEIKRLREINRLLRLAVLAEATAILILTIMFIASLILLKG